MGFWEDLGQGAIDVLNPFSGGAGPLKEDKKQQQPKGKKDVKTGWQGRFHADDMISSVYQGLSPEQTKFIRDTLAQSGLTEQSDPKEFRAGLQGLQQSIPGLKRHAVTSTLFPEDNTGFGTQPDPMAYQMFFNQSVAPYLDRIANEGQQATQPLYNQAMQHAKGLPGGYGGVLQSFLPMMQANQRTLSESLRGAAAMGPGLDAIVQNSRLAQAAALKSYYEGIAAKSAGTSGGTDMASQIAQLKGMGVKIGG